MRAAHALEVVASNSWRLLEAIAHLESKEFFVLLSVTHAMSDDASAMRASDVSTEDSHRMFHISLGLMGQSLLPS